MYDNQDLKLMASELTSLYGKEKAKEIMLSQSDNLFNGKKSVAYALGKRSLKFFALYYLRDMFYGEGKEKLSNTHYELWNSISDMFNNDDEYNKRNHLLSRGFGKTSIINVPSVIYAHCYGFSKFTVVGSAIKDTASSFMMSIREGMIDNVRLTNTFGELVSKSLIDNTERLQLTNDSMIMVTSARANLRGANYKGNRINLLVLDDYQSEENTTTREAMDKHWKKFINNGLPAVEKHRHWILAYGTTQKLGDFYNRLENDPTFKTYRKPAIDDITDIENSPYWDEFKNKLYNDRKNGIVNAKRYYEENKDKMEFKRVWNYFKCDDLAILYFTNKDSFMQEYQLELGKGVSNKFKNVVYTDDIMRSKVLVIDPATSSKDSADYTAFVVGDMEDDIVNIEYAEMDKLEFDDYISRTIQILKQFPNIDTVLVEKQTYNGADVIAMKNVMQRDEELYYRDIEWINRHQTKNKEEKINSIVGDVNLGRVRFNSILKFSNTLEQLKGFISTTVNKNDDFVDALAELVIYLKEKNLEDDVAKVYDGRLLF